MLRPAPAAAARHAGHGRGRRRPSANIDLRLTRGGVITGRVGDEDGEPLARALITVQRYQYVRGERQLQPAGGDQTDDRGQYRVFGLPPGDYYVSASTSGLGALLGRGMQQLAAGSAAGGGGGGRGGGRSRPSAGADRTGATGYAPTYYPGVVSAPEAGKVAVGAGPGSRRHRLPDPARAASRPSAASSPARRTVAAVMLVPQDTSGGRWRGSAASC